MPAMYALSSLLGAGETAVNQRDKKFLPSKNLHFIESKLQCQFSKLLIIEMINGKDCLFVPSPHIHQSCFIFWLRTMALFAVAIKETNRPDPTGGRGTDSCSTSLY